ncbi:Mitochondrial matrix cochaperone [Pleurotus pulmonarius]|nr:Mitochondrial matrix cochaperone [Pleurotus pulmonarius]KAF4579021.1 Mitochondrial matrix cochaperone [Pleurotus pulmonarius]KAF4603647.1 Mitochondrial matrix cochaperone [Pleurotus pulmonarius]KAF4608470.1 Mitochondrial matrix cochaperone [Pleurotus pulmonarius]
MASVQALQVFPRRHYSAEATESSAETKQSETKSEKSPETPLNPLEEKLKAKENEVADLTSRLRYLQADFLNLQRNAAREKEQTRDFAITRFASDLLETVDVLSLALKSIPPSALSPPEASPESPASESTSSTSNSKSALEYLRELHQGVEITQRQLLQTLFKYHVKPFDPTGDQFDPNLHEALYQAPIPGKEPGSVIDCQKMGYMIKDRVLRAAQVGVAQDMQS